MLATCFSSVRLSALLSWVGWGEVATGGSVSGLIPMMKVAERMA